MSVEDYSAARRGILQDVANDSTAATQPVSAHEEEPFDFKVDLVDIREKEQWGDTPLITLTPNRHQAKSSVAARYEDYILVLRRRFNMSGERQSTDLEVRSPQILRAFRIVLGDHPSMNFDSDFVAISKPYAPLFHYRKELRSYASDKSRTVVEKEHLDVLIKFMDKNLSQTERDYGHSEPYQMVSYPLLWTLFRPEEVIIAQGDHFDECYTVDTCEYVPEVRQGTDDDLTPYFKIEAKRWDYNGTRFGRKWREILEKTHMHYTAALAWSEPPHERIVHVDKLVPGHVSGRIMLDYETHAQATPRLATFLSTSGATMEYNYKYTVNKDYDMIGDQSMARKASDKEDRFMSHLNTPAYKISDDQALLTPARVRGYSFVEKIWAFFLVDEVRDIEWHPNAFESLELDVRMKTAILAMVSAHQNQDDFDVSYTQSGVSKSMLNYQDIVPGKGKGLVFLLYGKPGLGKTLTAEAVAEHIQCPMYSITSGELGTDIEQTDVQLRTIFTRAKAWDAIILLDEADVFLAKRTATDLKRNAYVSVFLRLIEYYKGTMFLTTNRLEDFDTAFESRIHLTIRYEALDSIRRTNIWRNFLNKVGSGRWDEATLSRLGTEYELNGREIKNLLRTALAISKYEKEELSEALIRRVLDLSREHLLGNGS
ncbi:uncharacterized protein J4E78_005677 [Alternaria triticimaculans]|uniref:uncharacterized protein n=1 Tax=Alternaria triticimaculans TaxID=297637 RepID=UPI0020C468B4|nr:uncharacterized protein J4E78_005677 [Alternaria triticimaculans]KAI4659251.1 hypothetical protein J4E78_005677 [Alternaria triticimaculans]